MGSRFRSTPGERRLLDPNRIWITIHDPRDDSYYRYGASRLWYRRHDNRHMISIGMEAGEVLLPFAAFDRMKKRREVEPISREKGRHSGCQSSCILRGGKECRW